MLKRKIDNYLTQWKNNRKNALIVYGARQIGKSYSIRKFIRNKENFDKYIEINFAERTNIENGGEFESENSEEKEDENEQLQESK